MSADNGVYILETRDQYRVIHAQAIENLYWCQVERKSTDFLISTRLVEYFGNVRYTRNKETAHRIANAIARKTPILEYGIKMFSINKTWNQIVKEAKEIAPLEIESLSTGDPYHSKHSIEKLQKILAS